MDFPNDLGSPKQVIPIGGRECLGPLCSGFAAFAGANAWPVSNRAFFYPFTVDYPFLAQKITFVVTTQSGNYDMGIFTGDGTVVTSVGSTAVPTAGNATADIADATLVPGDYYMAANFSSITAALQSTAGLAATVLESIGVKQQNVGATTFASPATLAAMASAYVPYITILGTATV